MAFFGLLACNASLQAGTATTISDDPAAACAASVQTGAASSRACAAALDALLEQAHRYYSAGRPDLASPYLRQAHRMAPNAPGLIYEQALVDDAQGSADLARKGYDRLKGTPFAGRAQVPSAVNLALLGRFQDAYDAFASIRDDRDAYLAGYAALWQLWLTARMAGDKPSDALREQLARVAVGAHGASTYQQALLDLYAGKGSVDQVFAAVDALTTNAVQQMDARSEATFFAGGYLQYVQRDAKVALQLYRRELPLTGGSVERPLIERAIASR